MKVFFDTNVYVAEALLGEAAEQMIEATERSKWRIYSSEYLLEELESVLAEELGFSQRLAFLSRQRIVRRAILIAPGTSRHKEPQDVSDSPILQAALSAGADYLVTNDQHLLTLNPYEGLRIVSMTEYFQLLTEMGLLES
jgi:putative PIN family toxin of toxin-antitoxin system